MATVAAKMEWDIRFTAKEFNLVLRGLRGQLDESQMPEANQLCAELSAQKVQQVANRLRENEKLANNLRLSG